VSDNAKTLLHYASNARDGCADDSDHMYCMSCARAWAAHIIGTGC
jgi:hypothetical protein